MTPLQTKVRISPLERLAISAADNILRGGADLSSPDQLKGYIKRKKELYEDLVWNMKALGVADALLGFLLFGKDVKIPMTEIQLQQIPAGLEVLAGISVILAFQVLHQAINHYAYQKIIEQFGEVRFSGKGIDADFWTASGMSVDFALKLYNRDFEKGDTFYYQPLRIFKIYSGIIFLALGFTALSVAAAHYIIMWEALMRMAEGDVWLIPYAAWLLALSVVQLLCLLYPSFPFGFTKVPGLKPQVASTGQASSPLSHAQGATPTGINPPTS